MAKGYLSTGRPPLNNVLAKHLLQSFVGGGPTFAVRPGMNWRQLCSSAGLLVLVNTGCSHHWVQRPPTVADISEINRIAETGDSPHLIALIPASGPAPAENGDATQPARPIVDAFPTEIQRIVAADPARLTVIDKQGTTRSVDLALLDGMTTRNRTRAVCADGALGALAGLGTSGLVAMSLLALNAAPDQSYPPSSPTSKGTALGIVIVGTLLGAILGVIIGDRNPEETFQFGAGR